MSVLKLTATAGPDGELFLKVPVSAAGDYEVTVTPAAEGLPYIHPSWPPGYFEETAGSITDPAFKRYPMTPLRGTPPPDDE